MDNTTVMTQGGGFIPRGVLVTLALVMLPVAGPQQQLPRTKHHCGSKSQISNNTIRPQIPQKASSSALR